jgi:hypothetical protein
MPRIARETKIACTASCVDLPDDPRPVEHWRVSTRFYHADELMTDRTVESRVPTCDLKIGVADPGLDHANQRLSVCPGNRDIG